MKKLRCTVEDVMSWGPCWIDDYGEDEARRMVEKQFGRKKYLTAQQILDLKISIADRLWAVLRPELIPERTLHLFGCWCEEWALKRNGQSLVEIKAKRAITWEMAIDAAWLSVMARRPADVTAANKAFIRKLKRILDDK